MNNKSTTVSRETLYEQIWTDPVTRVSERLGISDVGLAKICKKMNIPKPPPGYWARKEAGQPTERPPLPLESKITHWSITPTQDQRLKSLVTEVRNRVSVDEILVCKKLTNPFPIVSQTYEALLVGNVNDNGFLRARRKSLLAIRVSPLTLERACCIMDALAKALDVRGQRVHVTSGTFKTQVVIDGEKLEFSLEEKMKAFPREKPDSYRGSWEPAERWGHEPTGKLALRIDTYSRQSVRQLWADATVQRVENCLVDFVAGLHVVAQSLKLDRVERMEERHRQAQHELRRERQYRAVKLHAKRVNKLEKSAAAWAKAEHLRGYLAALEHQGVSSPREKRLIRWWRRYVDHIDPLCEFALKEPTEPRLY